MEPVVALLERVFGGEIKSSALLERDPKTRFQEWAHATLRETPRYRLVLDSEIEEAEDRFAVAVEVAGSCWGEGVGRSKRVAELAAAAAAMARALASNE
jgi:ribonuclease-3